MVTPAQDLVEPWTRPTRLSGLLFRLKQTALQAERAWSSRDDGAQRLAGAQPRRFPVLLGESRSPLWSDERAAEIAHQRGKVQNLRRACRDLRLLHLPARATFSFWRQLGRASRRRGYVTGRMLQQGCLVPATGGGLCQLSNALYDAALQAGCEIVERHAHSRIVPGSAATQGRDATVAWNYIDLRFRSAQSLLIDARLERDELVVRFFGAAGAIVRNIVVPQASRGRPIARSCATCNDTACHRHEVPLPIQSRGRSAYLLDENWPEFRTYVRRAHRREDVLGIPLDGARFGLARYRWETDGFSRVGSAPFTTAMRALRSRHLQHQGPARLQAQLAGAESLARSLSPLLAAEVSDCCVAQSLLPFLWRDGHLAARGLRVLMTRLPMTELQARLDAAWARHPERSNLHDFRAPDWLVDAESEALAAADVIVTPHAAIAALFPGKALLLDWQLPPIPPRTHQPQQRLVAFGGPTIARKGAHELREAARALDLEILLLGHELEGADFWRGVRTRTLASAADPSAWLGEAAALVQPALIEDQPRRLLAALAVGMPVIATPACGIAPRPGLAIVPASDPGALIQSLRETLNF